MFRFGLGAGLGAGIEAREPNLFDFSKSQKTYNRDYLCISIGLFMQALIHSVLMVVESNMNKWCIAIALHTYTMRLASSQRIPLQVRFEIAVKHLIE